MSKNIVLVGVGGQGTILISTILAVGLVELGYDVKMSEIHGMSQRGGSVSTQIRYGDKVYSPNIGEGEADIVVAFEKAEAIRGLPYLKKGGAMVVDEREIYPLAVLTGAIQYPDNILDELKKAVENVLILNATEIAANLGNIRAQNMVMLGTLVAYLGLEKADWKGIMESHVPEKAIEINRKAFDKGHELYQNHTANG
jgi:indolepyruvate ferredoxin oxidoreductase beta subunit